ncbi:MAG: hypothetical protein P8R42_28755 [Candidatus Binatia bacterium]|nr:hypothetical protein [Candidatus Binatia bacterium]
MSAQGPDYHQRIGVSFEIPNLYGKLTAVENLDFSTSFFQGSCETSADLLAQLDLPANDPPGWITIPRA